MNQIVQSYLILLDSVHMCACGILINPQLKIVMPSVAPFVERSGFVHSVFSYLLIEIPNRLALDFVFVVGS